MSERSALLLVNRRSRRGKAGLEAIQAQLRSGGMRLRVEVPEDPQRISSLIHELGPGFDLVILAGGDGTMNRSAAALLETGLPFGVLPLGTANDLARTLQIPADPVAACQVILSGVRHAIDLGRVNGHYFFNVASTGLSVRVARRLSGEIKQRWGVFGYLQSLVQAFRANRPFTLDALCDGEHHRLRSIQAAVGNGRHYGAGMTVSADAQIDDHLLRLYSLEPIGFLRLASLALALRTGCYRRTDRVQTLSGRQLELRTEKKPLPIDADGEVITHTPAHFDVLPAAIEVYVPNGFVNKGEN